MKSNGVEGAVSARPDGAAGSPVLVGWDFSDGTSALERPRHVAIPSAGLVLGGARIDVLTGGRHAVRDAGSIEGIGYNGERLVERRILAPGDVLRIGDTLFVYAVAPARGDAPAGDDSSARDGLVGSSAAMAAVRRSIDAVASRRHAVVITGATGTGKEVVARLLHERSGRTGPFIAVNCSTFSDALLSSELFGHTRGAFTGAVAEHPGLFRAASGGTLLLDELADMPLQVQAALLRVLEARTVRPIGGTRDIEVDVRVIATSNRDLVDLVRAGRFRADLYARLAQWTIRTPRLAERREDLPELVAHLLPRVDGAGRALSADLREALLIHDWSLNVRGLMNVLSIAVVSAPDDRRALSVTAEVRESMWQTRTLAPEAPAEPEPRRPEANEPVWAPRRMLDREELEGLLTRFEGQVAAAARHVDMTRPKLYRMLAEHGLEPKSFRRERPSPSSRNSQPPGRTP